MSKYKIWITIVINLLISALYFKQILYSGNLLPLLKTKEILLTPFLLFYTVLGIVICLFLDKKIVKNQHITSVILLIVILGFLIFPVSFLHHRSGYELALPFLSTLVEPIKVKYFLGQSIKVLLQKSIVLMVISFCLLFFVSFFFNMDSTNYLYAYGGMYFLMLAILDYYFHQIKFSSQPH